MYTELQASEARYNLVQERTMNSAGWGETSHCLKLTEKLLPRLSKAIEEKKRTPPGNTDYLHPIFDKMMELGSDRLALVTIQSALCSLVSDDTHVRSVSIHIGSALDGELYGRVFTTLKDISPQKLRAIEKKVLKKHGSPIYRMRAIRGAAKRLGLIQPRRLKLMEKTAAGGWLLSALLETLPDTFVTFGLKVRRGRKRVEERRLTLTDEALWQLDDLAEIAVRANPVYLPHLEEPEPWEAVRHSEDVGGRAKVLLRTHRNEKLAALAAAIESGQAQPALDAVNHVQSTAFKINTRILEVVEKCVADGLTVGKLPRQDDIPLPPKGVWEELSDDERRAWRSKKSAVLASNRALRGQRIALAADLVVARTLARHPAFWCMHSMDWRGRLYPLPHFNFQREDHVRALFLFRDGKPIGERGLWWLKVHLANCGDFGKISKRSFEERVVWVDEHLAAIQDAAADPLKHTWWQEADKPFLFLAACIELSAALEAGPEFITHLPCSWDGTCSGLQHLSAMSRAQEGEYVNLTPSALPQDVYQRVADKVFADLEESDDPLAQVCIKACTNRRKLVKRNVMTFPYSVTQFGMGEQHVEDTMEPLELKVLSGELPEHPYGEKGGRPAATFLANHTLAAIKEVVRKPAEVMAFLQDLARVMAHEGKAVEWTTPSGVPLANSYHQPITKRITLWLHDRGVKLPYRTVVADGDAKPIDKKSAMAAIAPNFVHALDAAHLALTVDESYDEGIRNFATVHDSFGCLAPDSDDMHRIIREQLCRMYEEHDVLGEVLERCKCALTDHNHHRLPTPVEPGSLDIRSVLDARYAFA